MEDLIKAAAEVGALPVAFLYVLWDHSKKLAAMQVSIVQAIKNQEAMSKTLDTVAERLEKVEDKL